MTNRLYYADIDRYAVIVVSLLMVAIVGIAFMYAAAEAKAMIDGLSATFGAVR